MFTLKGWSQGCVAGIIFGLSYNIICLHDSIICAIIAVFIVTIEANLLLLIFFKVCELLGL